MPETHDRIPSPDQVVLAIERVLQAEMGVTRPVPATADLQNDLALDSLSLITLVVALEDQFKVKLTEERGAGVRTVADLAQVVVATAAESR